jgi:hypothetical protein
MQAIYTGMQIHNRQLNQQLQELSGTLATQRQATQAQQQELGELQGRLAASQNVLQSVQQAIGRDILRDVEQATFARETARAATGRVEEQGRRIADQRADMSHSIIRGLADLQQAEGEMKTLHAHDASRDGTEPIYPSQHHDRGGHRRLFRGG